MVETGEEKGIESEFLLVFNEALYLVNRINVKRY